MDKNNLKDRIHEIAMKLSKDYPDIETCDPYEQLWAIEQGYLGTLDANDDLHKKIKELENDKASIQSREQWSRKVL